ncbi:hypothetical protein BDN72DRAFT_896439 [Pluteus cervinus]|uniref:Uncharacterized protein n=1 Tax=Pluteus cervinus TaxID=181527 RepID=A0ACD3AZP3_9AGAR|nr:hypothetical protein BDN72DRAFT_896439 [Pluteus cervinus]
MSNPTPTTEALRSKPSYPAPQKPPKWETDKLDSLLKYLKHHLQTAMLIELYTIPMYLVSYYSITKDPDSRREQISTIFKQEMLHLSLAGNILCSIGGTPITLEHAPEFPTSLFYDGVPLDLDPATKETIKVFVEVERPEWDPASLSVSDDPKIAVLPDYGSIGEFYQQVIRGITTLDDRMKKAGRELFLEPTFVKQYKGGPKSDPETDGSWHGTELTIIKNLQDATTALELIITQGEGSSPVNGASPGDSHYHTFKSIYDKYNLEVNNVQRNINPDDYKTEKIYVALLTADAIYSYLLLTIEKLWQLEDRSKRRNIVTRNLHGLMGGALGPFADFLVNQRITPESEFFAGPPFRKYDFGAKPAKDQLKDLIQKTVAAYPDEATLVDIQTKIGNLVPLEEFK